MRQIKSFFIITFILFALLVPQRIFVGKASSIFAANNSSLFDKKMENIFIANNEMIEMDLMPGLVENENFVRGGLLYDANENKIVWEKDMNVQFPIASLSKMMTALLVLEEINSGKIHWSDRVKMTKDAYLIYGSRVYMPIGRTYTVEELLNASMIASANNACYLLAQHINGSEKDFVVRMNERAKELKMENSYFMNCTGMPSEDVAIKDNFSSATDMLILAKELLKYDQTVEIASKDGCVIRNGYKRYFYRNHNRFVTEFKDEVDGLKTGWTVNAKYCLVATAKRCDHRLISIVLGASNGYKRYQFVSDLLNNYYCNIGLGKLGETPEEPSFQKSEENQLD